MNFFTARLSIVERSFILFVTAVSLLTLPHLTVSGQIDPSWQGALDLFYIRKFQAGKDYFFTYGPLGFLLSPIYNEQTFEIKVWWNVISKAVFAIVFVFSIAEKSRAVAWLEFCGIVIFFPWAPDVTWVYFVWILVNQARSLQSKTFFLLLVGGALAVVSLLKFTILIFAGIGVALILVERRFNRKAVFLTLTFLISLGTCWLSSGQALNHVFGYFIYSAEISAGFLNSMVLPGNSSEIVWALGIFGLLLFGSVNTLYRERGLFFISWAGLAVYLQWKHGFVRHDGHSINFFGFVLLFSLGVLEVRGPFDLKKRISSVALSGCVVLSLVGLHSSMTNFWPAFYSIPRRIVSVVTQLSQTRSVATRLKKGLGADPAVDGLVRVKATLGTNTLDLFSNSQGDLILNGLGANYLPRPAFQSYFAFTRKLIEANGNFYRSENAPKFVLMKLESIDNRFPTAEDSLALLQIFSRYRILFKEKGYWFLERQAMSPNPIGFSSSVFRGGGTLGVEQKVGKHRFQWVILKIKLSFWGKVRRFLFRPPNVFMTVHYDDGKAATYQIPPKLAEAGFLLNPFVQKNEDIQSINQEDAKRITDFRIFVPKNHEKYFDPGIDLQIFGASSLRALENEVSLSFSSLN